MSANFTPDLDGYSNVSPFKFWCQKVLPLVYDDSLSYYETLCKLTQYLNTVIENTATTEENIKKLLSAYNELQTYVNNYFTNLDIQNEINKKLDEMASDGTLEIMLRPMLSNLEQKVSEIESRVNNLTVSSFDTQLKDEYGSMYLSMADMLKVNRKEGAYNFNFLYSNTYYTVSNGVVIKGDNDDNTMSQPVLITEKMFAWAQPDRSGMVLVGEYVEGEFVPNTVVEFTQSVADLSEYINKYVALWDTTSEDVPRGIYICKLLSPGDVCGICKPGGYLPGASFELALYMTSQTFQGSTAKRYCVNIPARINARITTANEPDFELPLYESGFVTDFVVPDMYYNDDFLVNITLQTQNTIENTVYKSFMLPLVTRFGTISTKSKTYNNLTEFSNNYVTLKAKTPISGGGIDNRPAKTTLNIFTYSADWAHCRKPYFDVNIDTVASCYQHTSSIVYTHVGDASNKRPYYGLACSSFVSMINGYNKPMTQYHMAQDGKAFVIKDIRDADENDVIIGYNEEGVEEHCFSVISKIYKGPVIVGVCLADLWQPQPRILIVSKYDNFTLDSYPLIKCAKRINGIDMPYNRRNYIMPEYTPVMADLGEKSTYVYGMPIKLCCDKNASGIVNIYKEGSIYTTISTGNGIEVNDEILVDITAAIKEPGLYTAGSNQYQPEKVCKFEVVENKKVNIIDGKLNVEGVTPVDYKCFRILASGSVSSVSDYMSFINGESQLVEGSTLAFVRCQGEYNKYQLWTENDKDLIN